MSALVPVEQVTQAEALLAQAVGELERATTPVEALNAGDKARVVREFLELRAKGNGAHAAAYEAVVLADARVGELTRELPQAKRGPKPDVEVVSGEPTKPKGEVIAELGLSRQRVSELEALAAIPRDELRAQIEAGKEAIRDGRRPKPIGAVTSGSDHDGDQFSTPAKYVDPGRELVGGFVLDPASNERAQLVVQAERYFTRETNGLAQPWRARTIWLNPPYSRGEMPKWVAALLESQAANGFEHALVLTNADNSTEWWQQLFDACTGWCELDHRIPFELDGVPVKGNEHPQRIWYFGPKLPGFAKRYDRFGGVGVRYRPRRKQLGKGAAS